MNIALPRACVLSLCFCPMLLASGQIEAKALSVRIEDAISRAPLVGVRVYRFFDTYRIRHFLGIKGVPNPEEVHERRVSESYVTDKNGYIRMPVRVFNARLYERASSDLLFVNLAATKPTGDASDASAFYRDSWQLTDHNHFRRSVVLANPNYSGMILILSADPFDKEPRLDGPFGWFCKTRTGDSIVIRLAATTEGRDYRTMTMEFVGNAER